MTSSHETAERIAEDLLTLGAVILRPNDPFTWASGLKAPIYCDNRLTMGDVDVRERLSMEFARVVQENGFKPDVIAGTATAGIPHAAWLAQEMSLPMVYVRSKAKGHGRENLLEGNLPDGSNVVMVEDTISTGGSSLKAVQAIREAGGVVEAVVAIYTYGFERAVRAFEEDGVPLFTLTNYDALIKVAADTNRLNDQDVAALKAWRDDPEGWG